MFNVDMARGDVKVFWQNFANGCKVISGGNDNVIKYSSIYILNMVSE